jgi:hypothetical protein
MLGIFNIFENQKNMLLELTAFNTGVIIGRTKSTADDVLFTNLYELARTGTLTPETVNAAIESVKNPILAGNVMILLQALGASASGGAIVNLGAIDPAGWDAVKVGFSLGLAAGIKAQG